MKIVVMPKVGFCYGVERSITMTKSLLNLHPNTELNLLGMLVHNDIVNNDLVNKGFKIIDINDLDMILNNPTNSIFITTAHGISIENKNKILNKNYKLIDTTCPIVLNNNRKIYKYYNDGYDIIYVGKNNHQESNVIRSFVHLIENEEDLNFLKINSNKLVLTNQTTVSITELTKLTSIIEKKYPNILIDTCICPATKERQDAVLKEVKIHNSTTDKWIIIGDNKSNNTKKLVEIISIYTNNYYFINTIDDIENLSLNVDDTLYITSGTSTPNSFIDDVITELKKK